MKQASILPLRHRAACLFLLSSSFIFTVSLKQATQGRQTPNKLNYVLGGRVAAFDQIEARLAEESSKLVIPCVLVPSSFLPGV